MKKQTAVEWLVEQILPTISIRLNDVCIKELIEISKGMEKEQIIKAYETAMETDIYNEPLKIGKDYYNETFKSE